MGIVLAVRIMMGEKRIRLTLGGNVEKDADREYVLELLKVDSSAEEWELETRARRLVEFACEMGARKNDCVLLDGPPVLIPKLDRMLRKRGIKPTYQ